MAAPPAIKWPSTGRKLCALLGRIQYPILQSPMAGIQQGPKLAIAVAKGGGLGAIPCGMLTATEIERFVFEFRSAVGPGVPLNLNFFCHEKPALPVPGKPEQDQDEAARQTMAALRAYRKLK